MPRIRKHEYTVDDRLEVQYQLMCPGCGHPHTFSPNVHQFDGNMERPTINPSLLVTWTWGPEREPRRCHSYVRDGRIEFLTDCTHHMAGQTVELPEIALL